MSDDLPGDYDTIDGLKQRARALDNDAAAELVERAESRVVKVDGGYQIETPTTDADDAEMLFHFAVLTGAALERKYPAATADSRNH